MKQTTRKRERDADVLLLVGLQERPPLPKAWLTWTGRRSTLTVMVSRKSCSEDFDFVKNTDHRLLYILLSITYR